MKVSLGQHDPRRIRSESAIGFESECDVDRSAGRGFNLSALYALLMLVIEAKTKGGKQSVDSIHRFLKKMPEVILISLLR